MDRKLADILEKQADLTKQPFIQNDITERVLEKTGGEGLYAKFTIDLSVAHTDEKYNFHGDRLTVESVDDAVTIKLNSRKNDPIDLQKILEIHAPIKCFFITNIAGSGTLKLLCGSKGMFETKPVNTNSFLGYKMLDLSDDTTVLAAGTDSKLLQPPEGLIYELKYLYVYIFDPSGSGSGTHKLEILRKEGGTDYHGYCSSNTGTGIICRQSEWSGTNEEPSAPLEQFQMISGGRVWVSHEDYAIFKYTNNTDVSQTGTRTIRAHVKVYAEGF